MVHRAKRFGEIVSVKRLSTISFLVPFVTDPRDS